MGSALLAFREIRRSLGRFVILVFAISVLVFFLLFQQGLLTGLVTEFVGAIRNQNAQVLVYGELARDNIQASVVPPGSIDQVGTVDGVAEAGPLGVGTFTADVDDGNGGDRADVELFGYEPGGPGAPTGLTDGRLPEGPEEAVTSTMAGTGFGIGDTVRLTGGGPTIEIVGLAPHLSLSVVPALFVDTTTFEAAKLAQNPDAVAVPPSAVAVIVEDGVEPQTVVDAVNAEVDGVEALTRKQAEERAPGVAEVQQSFSITLLLGWVTVGAVIGFFFLILTTQKLPQLTLLRAVGVSTGHLAAAILVQILAVTAFALAFGAVIAGQALAGGRSGISAELTASQVGTAGVALVVFGLVALGVSALRISRLDPVDAVDGAAL